MMTEHEIEMAHRLGLLEGRAEEIHRDLVAHARAQDGDLKVLITRIGRMEEQLVALRTDRLLIRATSTTVAKIVLGAAALLGWLIAFWDKIRPHVSFH